MLPFSLQDGFKNLLEFATEAHICISENISIPVNINEDDVLQHMATLLLSRRRAEVRQETHGPLTENAGNVFRTTAG